MRESKTIADPLKSLLFVSSVLLLHFLGIIRDKWYGIIFAQIAIQKCLFLSFSVIDFQAIFSSNLILIIPVIFKLLISPESAF